MKDENVAKPGTAIQSKMFYISDILKPPDVIEFTADLIAEIGKKEEIVGKIKESRLIVADSNECIVTNQEEKKDAQKMLGLLKFHNDGIIEELNKGRDFLHKVKSAVIEKGKRLTRHIANADIELRKVIEDFNEAELKRIEKKNRLAKIENDKLIKKREDELLKQMENAKDQGKEEKVKQKLEEIEDLEETYIPEVQPEPKTRNSIYIADMGGFLGDLRIVRNAVFEISEIDREKFYEKGFTKKEVRNFESMLIVFKNFKESIVVTEKCIEFKKREFDASVQAIDVKKYSWGRVKKVPIGVRAL